MKLSLWHESHLLFAFPDYAEQNAARIARNAASPADARADNGALGLWCSMIHTPDAKPPGLFGVHLYQVAVDVPDLCVQHMPINELAHMHRVFEDQPEKWIAKRDSYLGANIKAIIIVESNGTVQQAVIMDYSIITSFEKIER